MDDISGQDPSSDTPCSLATQNDLINLIINTLVDTLHAQIGCCTSQHYKSMFWIGSKILGVTWAAAKHDLFPAEIIVFIHFRNYPEFRQQSLFLSLSCSKISSKSSLGVPHWLSLPQMQLFRQDLNSRCLLSAGFLLNRYSSIQNCYTRLRFFISNLTLSLW